MLQRKLKWCALLLVLPAVFPCEQQVSGGHARGEAPKLANNWWDVPDDAFVNQYGQLATGTQEQQSRFAWMAFARANQQVAAGKDQQKFSQWELWPDDPQTFMPDMPRFEAAKKVRTRPRLEPIQQLRMFRHHELAEELTPFPQRGQEVTRNLISYKYIMDKHLNKRAGIAAYLSKQGNKIDLPPGAVETKAVWVSGPIAGAYQVGGLSLTALHLMVKVRPTPNNPFMDNSPSWFWTTFELKSNKGLDAAQKFITYRAALPGGESAELLKQAGLGGTPFTNYVLNGQQTQFFDAQNQKIVLGNTQLEAGFATPPSDDPTTWKSWSSSCHSCHAQASGQVVGNGMKVFRFTKPVGPLGGDDLPSADYRSYDFVWALARAQ